MPGRSFVIKAHFDSVADMYEAFKKGPEYKEVWYGEHCIISTVNKNDPDNGKVFLRGVNYSYINDENVATGDAKFIGQIVGPSSGTPWFEMGGFDLLEKRRAQDLDLDIAQERAYPKSETEIYYDRKNGDNDPPLHIFELNTENGALVPGKTIDNDGNIVYNNAIKYSWVNIRSAYEDNDSWVYMGFQIPYPIVEFETESQYPYNSEHKYEVDSTAKEVEIEVEEGKEKPLFYKKYKIKIPQGVKGDSITGFRKHVVATGDVIYSLDDISYTDNHDLSKTGILTVAEKSTYNVDENVGHTVLLYDIETYGWTDLPKASEQASGNIAYPDKITVYIADYEQIERAYVSEDGTVSFFTNNNTRIDLTMIDKDGNPLYEYVQKQEPVLDDNGNQIYDENGQPVMKDVYDDDGNPVYTDDYLKDENGNLVPRKFRIKFIENIKLSKDSELEDDKRIAVKYNTSPEPVKIGDPINYVQEIVVDKKNYHLYILFNDKTHRFVHPTIPDGQTEDAVLGGLGITKENKDTYIQNGIRWVRKINLAEASAEIQNLLGWRQDENGVYGYDKDNQLANTVFWRDYCAVKDQSGILIGLNYTYDEIQDMEGYLPPELKPDTDGNKFWYKENENVINILNIKYPEGLVDGNSGDGSLDGKIVCVGDDPYDKRMYAFDYETKTWFYLGKTNENDMYDAKLLEKGDAIDNMEKGIVDESGVQHPPFTSEDYLNVTIHGLMFISRETDGNPEGIPLFWEPSYVFSGDDYKWVWGFAQPDGTIVYDISTVSRARKRR